MQASRRVCRRSFTSVHTPGRAWNLRHFAAPSLPACGRTLLAALLGSACMPAGGRVALPGTSLHAAGATLAPARDRLYYIDCRAPPLSHRCRRQPRALPQYSAACHSHKIPLIFRPLACIVALAAPRTLILHHALWKDHTIADFPTS